MCNTKLSLIVPVMEKPKFEKCKYMCGKEIFLHSTVGDPQFAEAEISLRLAFFLSL